MQKNLNVGFLTSFNARDRNSLSGTPGSMARALQRAGCSIQYLGPAKCLWKIIGKYYNYVTRAVANKGYSYDHSMLVAKRYATFFQARISTGAFDFIFAPKGSTEIALLQTKVPIVYQSDTTFALLNNYYPNFKNLLTFSTLEGNRIEKLAIDRAAAIIYPSHWAARSAVQDYGAKKDKIFIIPNGPNIYDVPDKRRIGAYRDFDRCKLLFVGVDWQRKGGETAVETVLELLALGVDSELTICGCVPPKEIHHPNIRVIPFLNKNNRTHARQLEHLFESAHFLILPTIAECFPNVICEASAFGLPAISSDTGGVPEVVRNGENGFLLNVTSSGKDYAGLIRRIYSDKNYHRRLCISTRGCYEKYLNWNLWTKQFLNIIERRLHLA